MPALSGTVTTSPVADSRSGALAVPRPVFDGKTTVSPRTRRWPLSEMMLPILTSRGPGHVFLQCSVTITGSLDR